MRRRTSPGRFCRDGGQVNTRTIRPAPPLSPQWHVRPCRETLIPIRVGLRVWKIGWFGALRPFEGWFFEGYGFVELVQGLNLGFGPPFGSLRSRS